MKTEDRILSRDKAEVVAAAKADGATAAEISGIIEDLRPDLAGKIWQLVDRQIIRVYHSDELGMITVPDRG